MHHKPSRKPRLSTSDIVNMSLGFLGIQFAFALQNGNASRILQTFGADVEHLSLFWLAAPITGMLIQPLIGHYSDRTWTRLGRRRPYLLFGALFTSIALLFMPDAGILAGILPPIVVGAGMLMIMDASINITMEPFRALIGDKLPNEQRPTGFSAQTFLIGLGAVLGSWLPYLLAEYIGIPKTAPDGVVPDNVIFSFYMGAAVLLITVLWTVLTTKEYTPDELKSFKEEVSDLQNSSSKNGLTAILEDIRKMPRTMKQLGLVQFFSWFALFSMWVFTTPAIAQHVYGVAPGDTRSEAYANAGNWVGILFGIYNGVSAVYALTLPHLVRIWGGQKTHAFSLIMGGISLISMFFITDPNWLILPMVGIGMAWGSILSMPYALLSASLPSHKMGVYMGIFNFFITFPQIINGFFGGYLLKFAFGGQAIFALVMAGLFMIFAAVAVIRVK